MTAKKSTLVPVDIPAGIVRNYTPVESESFYVDCNHVRFRERRPQKLGGWSSEISSNSIVGCARSIQTWQTLDATLLMAVGTHNHLYIREDGTYYDITPIRDTESLVDPLTTSSGSSEVSINDTLHSALVGDFINFPADVTYNGITFSGEYEVTEVTDADNYVIDAGTNATGTGTGGGSFDIEYLLESGLCDSGSAGLGWGTSTWGTSTWGSPRTSGVTSEARVWSTQNWGEDLLALPTGGKLYFWDTSVGTGTRASVVATAPSQSNWMIVSGFFRQCILFGTETVSSVFDPLLIRWSDREDFTDFDATVAGSIAGEFRLTKGTRIISAVETRNGEILVFTDKAVYRMRPRNDDLVYEVTLVSDTSGIVSPKAVVEVDGRVFWMSEEGLRVYDGVVRILPSTLDLFYFDSNNDGYFNSEQRVKCFAGRNREFDEIWFFLPDKDNTEINRYIIYNYKDNVFSDGLMERTAWQDAFVYDTPYAFSITGTLYSHETGKNDDGSNMNSYITTGFFKVQEGNQMLFVDRFIMDGTFSGPLSFDLSYKKFPNSTEIFTKNYSFTPTTNQIFTRARGRYMKYTVTSDTFNGDFRLGEVLASVQESGKR
jgi:hypothetical protein